MTAPVITLYVSQPFRKSTVNSGIKTENLATFVSLRLCRTRQHSRYYYYCCYSSRVGVFIVVDCNCLRSCVHVFVAYHRLAKRVYYRRLFFHSSPIIDSRRESSLDSTDRTFFSFHIIDWLIHWC